MTPRRRRSRRLLARSFSGRSIGRWAKSSGKPTPKILNAQRKIVDLLQTLVLMRPSMVCVIEDVLEGMLRDRRRNDHGDTAENENGDNGH